ncbi:MAG: hypothetical protein GXY85_06670 [Candidatus Brocadiaceae bacterium]|nr:hypothetical protein [Candidatus Brocadiaceae bacterium]
MPASVRQRSFVLTVSESKRLIARALKRHPAVMRALAQGTVVVAKGSTNGYVYEELAQTGIDKPHYCMGTTRPSHGAEWARTSADIPDLVLRCGEPQHGVKAVDAVADMGPGDVFIKGANALNYDLGQAAVLVGHPTGGTMGATLGTIVARRIHLIIPVGLEKSIPGDLTALYQDMADVGLDGDGPMLWPLTGEIFTEIEAVDLLSGARAAPIAAGGIAGAEGGIRLAVWGAPSEVDRAVGAIEDIRGEPPFLTP